MGLKKSDLLFLAALILSLALFYPMLFLAKAAALSGDHLEQHYPWAYLLARSIREGHFPFWTDLTHCGFPIIAEGQIGAFYLPNLILSVLLPFKWAYSYSSIVHFAVSGMGAYLYARQIKLDAPAAFVASFVFLFGSAFGGAFYNITSLKTLAWFPLTLFFIEKYFEGAKKRYLAGFAVSTALSLLAGYLQVAIITLGITLLYCGFRLVIFRFPSEKKPGFMLRKSVGIFIGVLLALMLAFPQLILSFQLALYSSRLNPSEDYAYVGSMSPLVLLTFFFPILQGLFRGNCLYSGLFTILLILVAVYSQRCRGNQIFKAWCVLAITSFFLALGEWSPLYIALIKITNFHSFRTPAKFLVYICFSCAVLGGFGFQELRQRIKNGKENTWFRKPAAAYLVLTGLFGLAHLCLYLFLTVGKPIAERMGRWFIAQFVYGRSGHPHDLETYYQKLASVMESTKELFSFRDPFNVWTTGIILLSVFGILLILRKGLGRGVLIGSFLFLFLDLRYFSEIDMKKDFKFYSAYERKTPVINALEKEKQEGRVERLMGFRVYGESLPVVPSFNMFYDIADIGVYSPFTMKRYFESIGQLGNINDSNLAFSPSSSFLLERMPLLHFMAISHILSTKPLMNKHLHLLSKDVSGDKAFLYRNAAEFSRAHFISNIQVLPSWESVRERLMSPGFDPQNVLLLEESELSKLGGQHDFKVPSSDIPRANLALQLKEKSFEQWEIQVNQPGFFVVTRTMYPGWTAKLNGAVVPILRGDGLFQAVWIPKAGTYTIVFRFKPLFTKVIR